MDAAFWRDRWTGREIAFHQKEANPGLVKYFDRLALTQGSRVFLPMCGKTRDIAWFLSQGFCVAGVEWVDTAVQELFAEMDVKPKRSDAGRLKLYQADGIDIFSGDFFDLSPEILGHVDAVYDRAALVALPAETRERYAGHMKKITNRAPQLLIHYEYDQAAIAGPPFSISDNELKRHYGGSHDLTLLEDAAVEGGMKGKCPAREKVWFLQKPESF